MGVYINAGKPVPPMVELRDIPNGAKFVTASGVTQTKVGWHKDSELTGAVKVRDANGINDYMCASAHVTPIQESHAG